MEMLLSVIMPVFNQERFLAETIESVLHQTYQDFEFLILDDGSKDKSAKIMEQYAKKDKRITPIFHKNAGRANATNYLISIAKGKFCALLDADDIMMPNRLEVQLAYHKENPEIDATSCNCYYMNDRGILLGKQRFPGLTSVAVARKALANNDILHCAITGLMVKKEVYLKIGGLRPAFWPCDDVDFTNRLIEEGFTLIIIQELLMKYRMHPYSNNEREPMHVYDTYGYVGYCCTLRRTGKSEISFAEFIQMRIKKSWWITFNQKRYNLSQMFFRRAAFELMSKHYFTSLPQIIVAFIFSPVHVFKKVRGLVKR